MSNIVFKYSSELQDIQYPEGIEMKYLGLVDSFHFVSVGEDIKLSEEFIRVIDINIEIPSTKFNLSETDQYNYGLISLDPIKENKVKLAKIEAAKRIEASYPQYKQINYGAAVLDILNKENYSVRQGTTYPLTDEDRLVLSKAKACKDFISLIRSKSDDLETLINSKRTIGTLTSINVSDDIYWS